MRKIWKISDLWAVIDKITEVLVLIFFGIGQSMLREGWYFLLTVPLKVTIAVIVKLRNGVVSVPQISHPHRLIKVLQYQELSPLSFLEKLIFLPLPLLPFSPTVLDPSVSALFVIISCNICRWPQIKTEKQQRERQGRILHWTCSTWPSMRLSAQTSSSDSRH